MCVLQPTREKGPERGGGGTNEARSHGNGLTSLYLRAGRGFPAGQKLHRIAMTIAETVVNVLSAVMAPLGIVSEKWPRRLNLNKRRHTATRIKRFIGAPRVDNAIHFYVIPATADPYPKLLPAGTNFRSGAACRKRFDIRGQIPPNFNFTTPRSDFPEIFTLPGLITNTETLWAQGALFRTKMVLVGSSKRVFTEICYIHARIMDVMIGERVNIIRIWKKCC